MPVAERRQGEAAVGIDDLPRRGPERERRVADRDDASGPHGQPLLRSGTRPHRARDHEVDVHGPIKRVGGAGSAARATLTEAAL